MHKVFISYHHFNDQDYKDELLRLNANCRVFLDQSVNTHDISDDLPDESIRQIIRDKYLRDSTVTIVLVGTETKNRKHVDWEIYSSMFDGKVNKKSGILVINLPSTKCHGSIAPHGDEEKQRVHPRVYRWKPVGNRAEVERDYPLLPERIIDNIITGSTARISVVPWSKVEDDSETLRALIAFAYRDRASCQYDLRREMRRRNS